MEFYSLGSTDTDMDSNMDTEHSVCEEWRTQTQQGHRKNINISLYISIINIKNFTKISKTKV